MQPLLFWSASLTLVLPDVGQALCGARGSSFRGACCLTGTDRPRLSSVRSAVCSLPLNRAEYNGCAAGGNGNPLPLWSTFLQLRAWGVVAVGEFVALHGCVEFAVPPPILAVGSFWGSGWFRARGWSVGNLLSGGLLPL